MGWLERDSSWLVIVSSEMQLPPDSLALVVLTDTFLRQELWATPYLVTVGKKGMTPRVYNCTMQLLPRTDGRNSLQRGLFRMGEYDQLLLPRKISHRLGPGADFTACTVLHFPSTPALCAPHPGPAAGGQLEDS